VKLHALAQRQLDGALVDALPALGQARHRLELAHEVLHDQRFEDEREGARADVGLLAQGLQRGAVGDLLDRDGDAGAAVGLADGHARQGGAGGGKAGGGDQTAATQEHGANSPCEGRTLGAAHERAVSI
jgi:hypothetical protein